MGQHQVQMRHKVLILFLTLSHQMVVVQEVLFQTQYKMVVQVVAVGQKQVAMKAEQQQ